MCVKEKEREREREKERASEIDCANLDGVVDDTNDNGPRVRERLPARIQHLPHTVELFAVDVGAAARRKVSEG